MYGISQIILRSVILPTTLLLFASHCVAEQNYFRAGVAAVDVTPLDIGPTNPSIIAGGFLEAQATTISDTLYARSFVLDDGKIQICLCVVDTCMMTQKLIDDAKSMASQQCGIAVNRIMVSATHTHSAPAAMGCLGTRQDKKYAAWLPGKIAESIVQAHKNLQPARIGWASVDDWHNTHNRRWIRKPESKVVDPFGEATGLAHMHPGYQSSEVIGPSGPVDPSLSVIALQSKDGQPLAVFANYSQHYFGSPAVSSDYYGLFCRHMATIMRQPGAGNGPFVAAISQGTSGDLMWMDYGSPASNNSLVSYAEDVARSAEKALAKVVYTDDATLGFVEHRLQLKYRVPDEKRLEWARKVAANIQDDKPKSIPEVYAREAIILHELQKTELKLQAIRIGDLTIATLPNEVYALTGLKLRSRSPSDFHFNIELANGAEGYIPPPEQHALGGYTTWPARTAGLEVQAETKIVDSLVEALEAATGKQRRNLPDQHGPYAQQILSSSPQQYWRLNDQDGSTPINAVESGVAARLTPGFAFFLPGPGSGTGIGRKEALKPSEFSGPNQINRAVHLAGGSMQCNCPGLQDAYTVCGWFWLGEQSGASSREGALIVGPGGENLIASQAQDHEVTFSLLGKQSSWKGRCDNWNFVALVRQGKNLSVYVNGAPDAVLLASDNYEKASTEFTIGVGLQGKVDEVALFSRALSPETLTKFWDASNIEQEHNLDLADRERALSDMLEKLSPPNFSTEYQATIDSLKPRWFAKLDRAPANSQASGRVSFHSTSFALFRAGRLSGAMNQGDFTISLWFRNDLAIGARAVTAYLFSRGPNGDNLAAGDHLGIGGTYRSDLTGKLILFNGNRRDQVLVGKSVVIPGYWHHAVFVRSGDKVSAYLNGKLEIDGQLDNTAVDVSDFFLGARNDQFAPLQGGMAYAAIFDKPLNASEVTSLFQSAGIDPKVSITKPAGGSAIPKPTSQPLSAEQSISKIHVPLGYRAHLVACEPDVLDPVAFDWDSAGRLWVVEMADYPLGMDGKGKAGGRVRVLEDVDRDGRYEKSQLFADGLNFPNGILTWRDGVLVTAAPQLLFLRDTDGDGKADSQEVLFEGFNQGNQQLRMNGLRWGLDNWVYCANGGHHPGHGLGIQVESKRNGKKYELGSRDFRFNPDSGELETESGPSQFGRNRDAWGHWFGTQNANPLWHYVLPDRYLARNPYVATISPVRHVLPTGSPPVYPASSLEKRYHSFEQSGRYTSACGSTIYGDDLLFPLIRPNGAKAQDAGEPDHCFTCEPFHNLVQHNWMKEDGVSYSAVRPDNEGSVDFFSSEDRWCRPVMVRTGPDGALWVADMYRYMIEHPDWLPDEGKAELLPHYRLGDDRGRIYRVLPSIHANPKIPDLTRATSEELVRHLSNSNVWIRDKAHQMLLWRNDKKTSKLLEASFLHNTSPLSRVHILHLLDGMSALQPNILASALNDAHPRVRENAVRLAEKHASPEIVAEACKLASDADMKVCLQLTLSIGQWRADVAGEALVVLAKRFADNVYMKSAIMSSALAHERIFAAGIGRAEPAVVASFREPLLRQSIGRSDLSTIAVLLDSVLSLPPSERTLATYELLNSLQSVGSDLSVLVKSDSQGILKPVASQLDQLINESVLLIGNSDLDTARRITAAQLLLHSQQHRQQAITSLAQWLKPQVDPMLQSQALLALQRSADEQIPLILHQAWNEWSPDLRTQAIDAWLSREKWTNDLIHRLESKQISLSSISLTQRARLLQHPTATINQRSKQLFSQTQTSARSEVLSKYGGTMQLTGDSTRGKAVFQKSCANCHRRGAEGQEVGPNLATVVGHAPEKLLTNILDPNVDIQPGYQAYTCLLDSGEVLSGLLVSETANSVTIKQANGVLRSIARGEIEKLQNSNKSFMPEGLEDNISQQDMADLIRFLREPLVQTVQ
jgi:putative membrane-bound dehydrogenase-like protein